MSHALPLGTTAFIPSGSGFEHVSRMLSEGSGGSWRAFDPVAAPRAAAVSILPHRREPEVPRAGDLSQASTARPSLELGGTQAALLLAPPDAV